MATVNVWVMELTITKTPAPSGSSVAYVDLPENAWQVKPPIYIFCVKPYLIIGDLSAYKGKPEELGEVMHDFCRVNPNKENTLVPINGPTEEAREAANKYPAGQAEVRPLTFPELKDFFAAFLQVREAMLTSMMR